MRIGATLYSTALPISTTQLAMRNLPTISRHVIPLNGRTAPPEWWSVLFDKVDDASIFISPAWTETWLELYGREFDGCWVRWDASGSPVGGCLLLTRTVWLSCCPIRTLFVNASGNTTERSPPIEYNRVLCLAGFEGAIAEDLASLLAELRWTRLELSGYEESILTRTLLARLPISDLEHVHQPSRYVNLSAIADSDFEATLSSTTRGQIRRCRRMYEEAHGPVVIDVPATVEQSIDFLSELAQLHNVTWRSRGIEGAFESSVFVDFHRTLVRRLWQSGGADILRVRAGNRVLGYLYSFLRNKGAYNFQTGLVQEQDNRLKPGMLAHATAVRHYRERGFREYDLLAGDMRYKSSLTQLYRTQVWTTAYRRGVYSHALLIVRNVRRKLRARMQPAADGSRHSGDPARYVA